VKRRNLCDEENIYKVIQGHATAPHWDEGESIIISRKLRGTLERALERDT